MSHFSKVFNDVEISVQDRSGFDLSHENLFTTTVGTLTPCLVEELYPSDVISLNCWWQTKTPPLATSFYGHVDANVEFFFIPMRTIWGSWKDFISNGMGTGFSPDKVNTTTTDGMGNIGVAGAVPTVDLGTGSTIGTLADYLGIRENVTHTYKPSALPFLAYHKVWEDYYRNALITRPFFNEAYGSSIEAGATGTLVNMPYTQNTGSYVTISSDAKGNDLTKITELHQRCWAKDAYTTATKAPQFNSAAISVIVPVEEGEESVTGSFSIASLRAANALQKFLERNNLGSSRYYDNILAHFGVVPSDACMRGPIFLKQLKSTVYANSVSSTAQGSSGSTSNPFGGSVGAQYGQSVNIGEGNVVDNWKVTEHGYLMGIYSLVPHANYGSGVRKYLNNLYVYDFFWPEFAGLGDEPIDKLNLYGGWSSYGGTFGYNCRYWWAKYHDDEVHGLFVDGNNLDSFVLQRTFNSGVTLSTDFLEIPITAMDKVLAVSTGVSHYTAMVDMYFDFRILRRLPESPLPYL